MPVPNEIPVLQSYAPIGIAIGGVERIMNSVETLDQPMIEHQANCKMYSNQQVDVCQSHPRAGDPMWRALGTGRGVEPFSWEGFPETAHRALSP